MGTTEYRKGVRDGTIWITDLDDSSHSVLHDLDAVIPALIEEYGDLAIVYRDRFGWWHMIAHEGGIFVTMERLPSDFTLLI